MPKIEPGIILKDRYQITQQLGFGGMGEVFLADDLTLQTPVAVKINHNLNETTSAQFIREARLLAGLKHPNLPRVIDYFTDNDCQFLVMDYIPGVDLKTIVDRRDKLNPELIVKWAVELGNALTYLHNHKPPIFHRDIKPANIKLTPSGDVVLVDFGIAKTGDPSQETQTGAWAFSPGFAPPEQVSGMRTGPYSDQYSLAATIYYLLVGKSPADSAQRMMGSANYIPLNEANPAVSAHISDAIGKALAIRPEDRFGSIAEFLTALTHPEVTISRGEALKTVMAGRPPASPPPPVASNSGGKTKSSGVWIVAAVVALLALGGGGYYLLHSLGFVGAVPTPTAQPTAAAAVNNTPTLSAATSAPKITATATANTEPTATSASAAAVAAETIGHGGKVAFISNRQGDGYYQVWLMAVGKDAQGNLVASNFQQLTQSESDKSQPSWSPDGKKLLYTAASTKFAQNGTPFAKDIWVIDLSQQNPTPVDLTNRAGDDTDASWSPNGKKIAFTSYYRDDGMPQLFLMNADGSEQTRLSERFSEHYSAWTPDASFLLYVMEYQGIKVLSMRDGYSAYKDTRKFDMSSDAGRLGAVSDPQITLDGSMIAYTRTQGAKQNIYTAVFKDRGRTVTQLTTSGKDYAACWSPDGKWVAFTSERDDNAEIYIVGADGKNLTDLTNHPAQDKEPAWQPESQ